MGYDGKILRRALDRFEADKAARAQDFQRRRGPASGRSTGSCAPP